jgi:hypothetical protein
MLVISPIRSWPAWLRGGCWPNKPADGRRLMRAGLITSRDQRSRLAVSEYPPDWPPLFSQRSA